MADWLRAGVTACETASQHPSFFVVNNKKENAGVADARFTPVRVDPPNPLNPPNRSPVLDPSS
jgi:hypothetical protein